MQWNWSFQFWTNNGTNTNSIKSEPCWPGAPSTCEKFFCCLLFFSSTVYLCTANWIWRMRFFFSLVKLLCTHTKKTINGSLIRLLFIIYFFKLLLPFRLLPAIYRLLIDRRQSDGNMKPQLAERKKKQNLRLHEMVHLITCELWWVYRTAIYHTFLHTQWEILLLRFFYWPDNGLILCSAAGGWERCKAGNERQ